MCNKRSNYSSDHEVCVFKSCSLIAKTQTVFTLVIASVNGMNQPPSHTEKLHLLHQTLRGQTRDWGFHARCKHYDERVMTGCSCRTERTFPNETAGQWWEAPYGGHKQSLAWDVHLHTQKSIKNRPADVFQHRSAPDASDSWNNAFLRKYRIRQNDTIKHCDKNRGCDESIEANERGPKRQRERSDVIKNILRHLNDTAQITWQAWIWYVCFHPRS